jgi:hypothetical protein
MQTDTTKTGNILQILAGIAVIAFLIFLFGGAWNGYFAMPRGMFPEATPTGRIARYEAFYESLAAKRPADAVKAAQVIFKKDPKGPKIDEVRRLTLDAYLQLRRYDDAIVMAQVLSNAHPKDPRFRFILAQSFIGLGRIRDAHNTYLELSLRKDLTQKERDDVKDALAHLSDGTPEALLEVKPVPPGKTEQGSKSQKGAPLLPLDAPPSTPIPMIDAEKNPTIDPLNSLNEANTPATPKP